ncbi:MAG TPA: TIGR03808 family TAT-translocated repetitive protein, partial [Devosia sp.]|nr:TIGR03808 family TAT-translocated repetitive protein [Devosia sp.]
MMHLTRRTMLAGLGALGLVPAAQAQPSLDLAEFGITPDLGTDQSAAMQAAIDAAAQRGLVLALPAGTVHVRDLALPSGLTIEGIAGRSVLATWQDGIIAAAGTVDSLTITGVSFDGGITGAP